MLKKFFRRNDANLKGLMSDAIEDIISGNNEQAKDKIGMYYEQKTQQVIALAPPKRPPISLKKKPLPSDQLFDYIMSGKNKDVTSNGMGYILRKREEAHSIYTKHTYNYITIDFESMYGNYFIYKSYHYGSPDATFSYRETLLDGVYTQEELAMMYEALDKKYKEGRSLINLVEWRESIIQNYLDAKNS